MKLTDTNKNLDYPQWVCFPCGNKYGRGMPENHVCTMHFGTCGICGEERAVTDPCEFGHIRLTKEERK